VGEVIAIIETEGSGDDEFSEKVIEPAVHDKKQVAVEIHAPQRPHPGFVHAEQEDIYVSPLVRMLARQRGIPSSELKQIRGSGLGGRITREDMIAYMAARTPFPSGNVTTAMPDQQTHMNSQPVQEIIPDEEDEVVEMDRMRKLIASHMIRSKRVAPHVTSFLEADLTVMAEWRANHKDRFLSTEMVRLTFTPLFVEAVSKAIKDFPGINVAVSGDHIILRKNINVGVATALPSGNLIVPVIRNADRENLGGLARKITDLAERARTGALVPGEIKGGTFTITNIGQYNNLTGTPIINQPESAILAIGTIVKKPWAVKTPAGYGIAVRDIAMLSLTYDHRVIDGALGGSFLSRIVWYLENFDAGREI
jgi:2-oxoglutarate dehydrogenase E2 component (dihydrolipoamide succinyltransferase)